jgi:hypothetical protein
MMQSVVVTRLADRHADLHTRDFADSFEVVVPAGDLADVLLAAAGQADGRGVARYSLTISEPFE